MLKPKVNKRSNGLYQIIGILLLCVSVFALSFSITSAWFTDKSVTSNGEPNILIVGTVDLDVTTFFNFYNLVLAPDTLYLSDVINGETKSYKTTVRTSDENDVRTIYVRAKFTTNRSELSLYFENLTTATTYNPATCLGKWYLHTDGYYYYIGAVGGEDVTFNTGYYVNNELHNDVAKEAVELEFVFESIQRPYGAYKEVWPGAPTVFNQFALADAGV